MHTVRTERSTRELGQLFAHAFIPIALAYLVAHYFSLFIFSGAGPVHVTCSPTRSATAPTSSAPRPAASTTRDQLERDLVRAGRRRWSPATSARLVLGHDRALSVYGDARTAARSQYWMLALMVGFTSLGLFLLSQSNS